MRMSGGQREPGDHSIAEAAHQGVVPGGCIDFRLTLTELLSLAFKGIESGSRTAYRKPLLGHLRSTS